MMNKKIVLLIILCLFFMFGCIDTERSGNTSVQKRYDEQTDVICYLFCYKVGYAGAGGLSCLPRNQTSLTKQEALKLNN